MSGLPPIESAHLETAHLQSWGQVDSAVNQALGVSSTHAARYRTADTPSRRRRLPVSPLITGVVLVAISLPTAFLYLAQPHQPTMDDSQQQKMAMYLDENKQAQQQMVASAQEDQAYMPATLTGADTAIDETPLTATTDANLVASNPNVKNKTYAYHLTLAQGFLKKAIDLSQQTTGNQSEQQKADIKKFLDQALEEANKAIEADAREGAGFLVRARVYKTSAVLDPSLSELSDQDLQIARALGIDSNYLDSGSDVYDLLPTQQATDLAGAPVIADPEEGNQDTVTTATDANAQTGTVVMSANQTETTVSLPSLQDGQTLQVEASAGQDTGGATFIIKSQTAGQGFTVQSTQALDHDVTLQWRVIQP